MLRGGLLPILATLAPTEDCARDSVPKTLTIFFETLGFLALTAFPHFFRLVADCESLLWPWVDRRVTVLALPFLEGVGVAGKRFHHGLPVLLGVASMVTAPVAPALSPAKHFALEAFAV